MDHFAFSSISSSTFDIDASGLVFTEATRSTRYIIVIRENSAPQNPVDRYTVL